MFLLKTVTRSQVIPAEITIKIKEIKTIGGNIHVSVTELLKYSPKKDSYKVKFDIPDENNSNIETIKANELRTNKPLEYSKIELEYPIINYSISCIYS
jgi:hypothetical protein